MSRPSSRPSRAALHRFRLAVLACATVAAATGAGAGPVRFLAGDRAAIPFMLNNGHVLLRGSLAGRDSVTFILDSGASGSVLDEAVARRLGLEVKGGRHAHGAGGAVDAGHVAGVTLDLPGLSLPDLEMTTLSLAGLSAHSGLAIDGIIGRPLFEASVVRLDYERGLVTVMDADGGRDSGDGQVLPLTFEQGLPYVTARVTLPGHPPLEGRFQLDIGASTALTLAPDVVERERALASAGRTIVIVTGGIGGAREGDLGRGPRLELGRFALDSVLTLYRRPGPGAISARGTLGNIGSAILNRFTVTFDYPHRRVILEPNDRLGERFAFDMSGMGLRTRGAAYDTVEVAWLLPDGPAAAAGLQAGDVVESLDGAPARALGLEAIRKRLRNPGPVQLGVLRAGERRDVRLVARPLI